MLLETERLFLREMNMEDFETCGSCPEMETCEKLSMITGNNAEALQNLQG